MTVPFCTGVPAPEVDVDVGAVGVVGVVGVPGVVGVVGVVGVEVVPFSIAVATISISPFKGTVFDVVKIEMTVPPGARSGTLSQAELNISATESVTPTTRPIGNLDCASIEATKDSNCMGLRGQDSQRGYAMAALLVTLAIMGILLTILMPVWRHEAQREKEAELVFRGEQYARAIALFKFKNQNIPNALPPSIDFLVENRFLRKKYKDPMTKDGEFLPLSFGSQTPGVPGGQKQPGPTQPGPSQPGGLKPPSLNQPAGRSNTPLQPTGGAGGISGVRSKSEETSIRSYRGATRYDQWLFTFNVAPRPGGAMPMADSPDGRGVDPNNPTGPGGFPQRGNTGRRGFGQGGGAGQGGGGARGGFPPPTQPPAGGGRTANPGGRGPGR